MSRYTSPHDEPWFSDPDQPWGGSHKRIERDPDYERDRAIDEALMNKSPRGPVIKQVSTDEYLATVGRNLSRSKQ